MASTEPTVTARDLIYHHREASGRTAIRRKTWSAPLQWLYQSAGILDPAHGNRKVLDYGCGHGADVRVLVERGHLAVGFDPVHAPNTPYVHRGFDLALCTYVLNTLPTPAERMFAVAGMLTTIKPGGIAYITVSRDAKATGWTEAGTFQNGAVSVCMELRKAHPTLHCVSIHPTSGYEIYMIVKPAQFAT